MWTCFPSSTLKQFLNTTFLDIFWKIFNIENNNITALCNQWCKLSSLCVSQVEDRVFEDVLGSAPEISSRGVELRPRGAISGQDPRAIRRRTWSRDEVYIYIYILLEVPIYIVTTRGSTSFFCFFYNKISWHESIVLLTVTAYAHSAFTGCAGQFAVGISLPAFSKNQTGHGKDSQQNQVNCSSNKKCKALVFIKPLNWTCSFSIINHLHQLLCYKYTYY